MSKFSSMGSNAVTTLVTLVKTALGGKVDKVDGKGLSSNDYTGDEKTKLAGIAEEANKTAVVDSLTSTDAASALSANQGKVLDGKIQAVSDSLDSLGYGDMLKSAYDADGDGVVDNASQLGGQAPSYYAAAADVPTKVSDITNDAGFQTASQVSAAIEAKGYQTASQVQDKINAAATAAYKPSGSVAFAALPAADEVHVGMVYNVTDAFTTTDGFLEGEGNSYPAGSNVAVVVREARIRTSILTGENGTLYDTGVLADKTGAPIALTDGEGAVYYIKYVDEKYYKTPHSNGKPASGKPVELDRTQPEIAAAIQQATIPAGFAYDVLGGFVDLSGYLLTADLQELTADEVTAIWDAAAV